jgi:formylglycine-generating enzyme required for sulfatase activity
MKRRVILRISLLLAGVASMKPVSVQAESMAVLVVGLATDAASDEFAAGIKYEYTQKGYTMVTSKAVSDKITELRNKYKQNPPVDTAGLAAWGKTNSIDFVQLVVESACTITVNGETKSGREQLSQVVRCGSAQYSGRGYYRTRFIPQPPDININLGTAYDEMVYVAGGVFEMGCESGGRDGTCGPNGETPVHYVRVNSFHIGKYEVTQALWKKVMGSNPSIYSGDNQPVEYVNWNDIVGSGGFLEKLNAMTGKNYRLPTEAEWEYAARGCSGGVCESYEYSGSDTVGDVAYCDQSSGGPVTVGSKRANGLGLYDMNGNVWEWCSDLFSFSYYPSGTTPSNPQDNPTGPTSGYNNNRVRRGGGWFHSASFNRVAYRASDAPSNSNDFVGFRLV